MMRSEFSFRRNGIKYDPIHDSIENQTEELGTKLANMPYRPLPGSGEVLLFGGTNVKDKKPNRIVYSYKEDQTEWTEFTEFPTSKYGHNGTDNKTSE